MIAVGVGEVISYDVHLNGGCEDQGEAPWVNHPFQS